MMLPGLSGSFILILLGNYELLLVKAVTDINILLLSVFFAGSVFGVLAFSHLLSWLLKKYNDQTLALLTGFIAGSLAIIWPWKEVSKSIVIAGKEKIIEYEAVHEINSWNDLRARLAPSDRQCFAFFHPLIPNDPLIFVEVALCNDIPKSIQEVIRLDRNEIDIEDANTAIFYSISNCQNGLLGISFGNFLIKKVAKTLKRELPDLNQFLTLSPIPGLMKWMEEFAPITFERCTDKNCSDDELMKKTIKYLTESDRDDGMPNDPVGRFHIGNGASLERVNLSADLSEKGLSQSYGIMANYLYDLEVVEENHEMFFKNKAVLTSNEIKLSLIHI